MTHLVKGCQAMQQAMSCACCLLLIARLCIAALQTNWRQGDSVGVLLWVQRWTPHSMHEASTACSANVDLLQLCKVHCPCGTELAPHGDGLVHGHIAFEAPAAKSQACGCRAGSTVLEGRAGCLTHGQGICSTWQAAVVQLHSALCVPSSAASLRAERAQDSISLPGKCFNHGVTHLADYK